MPAKSTDGTATENKKERKPRTPSLFKAQVRVSVMVHDATGATVEPRDAAQYIADAINAGRAEGEQFAIRVVARSRKQKEGAKTHSTTQSSSVYIAPHGYEFPKVGGGGVRLAADTWAQAQAAMSAAGIDPTPENLSKLLAALANNAK